MVPVVAAAGQGPHVTPPGVRPIERYYTGERWVEFPFDDLVPGDAIRDKGTNAPIWEVKSLPTKEYGVMGIIVEERCG